MALDLIIRGGTVHDGLSGEPFTADIGVTKGRIAGADAREINVDGLAVSPGFIDIHAHSNYTLLIDPCAVSALAHGVTLEVLGNCGFGCAPIRDPLAAAGSIYGALSHFLNVTMPCKVVCIP